MKAINKKIWRDLWNLKIQSFTIAFILIGGIALLISSLSSYESLKKERDYFYDKYSFADIFAEFKRAPNEIIYNLRKIPGIQTIEGRIVIDGLATIPNQIEPAVTRIVSIPSGTQPLLNKLYLRSGRMPVEAITPEVVVHEAFARAHHLTLGRRLQVLVEGHYEEVQITGIATSPEYVYALSSLSVLPDDLHFGVLWMPYKTLARIAKLQDSINSITLTIGEKASPLQIRSSLDNILKKYGAIGTYLREEQISNRFVQDEINEQKAIAFITPFIFLSVAAFLTHVIFLRLISLNRSQIATLKAIGFTNFEIASHYLKLVILISLIGVLPGIAIGIYVGKIFAKIYMDFFHFPELIFSLSYPALIIAVLAGILPGVLGASQSIMHAFSLVPAEAMRPPKPPTFQRSFFDKLTPKKLKPLSKMIFRNMFFRPGRFLMITFGMALALGIIVIALSWGDMIEHLLDTQFHHIQREDISLTFFHPIPTNGLQELTKLNGVMMVEGYRTVPVRIKHLNRKKELAIFGLPSQAKLRQLLDTDLKIIPLTEDGLLLGRYFESWNLKPGDSVQVEVLEGKQQTFDMRVAGFSDEMFGLTASMRIESLWKILGEQPGYNMAMLKADPKNINQLYFRLKEIPEIISVGLKDAMYKGFQNSMGNIISVSSIVLISFALAISMGVIYNSIRVNFSERSWEMATLEIMGLGKMDVFMIIFVEVTLQVLFSIIPGCFLGYIITVMTIGAVHTEAFVMPVIIQFSTYLKSSLAILLTLIGSSLIVYFMVNKLSLVKALKSRE